MWTPAPPQKKNLENVVLEPVTLAVGSAFFNPEVQI
jgi:hypothetical protein